MIKRVSLGFLIGIGLLYGAVDINNASLKELTILDGIGKKKAQAIIEYREKRCFSKASDLLNVKGIGEKIYQKIEKEITVGECKNKKDKKSKK